MSAERERSGVFIGAYAINPMTEERIPIWIADYVLPGYGTGRDHGRARPRRARLRLRAHATTCRFATSCAPRRRTLPQADEPFVAHTADEVLVDSGEFTGMPASEAIARHHRGAGRARASGARPVSYRIRDWLISRQRYWGAPIPIVYCPEHGAQPVPEDQLPVLLPQDVDFAPTGVSPLQSHAGLPAGHAAPCAAGRRAARRTPWTPSWTRPGISCATARRTTTTRAWDPGGGDALDAGRPVHRRRRARGAAPDVRALLRQGAARHGAPVASTSRSWRCATRARSWARTTTA